MPDYARILRKPVMGVFGKLANYVSPDKTISVPVVGTTNKVPVVLDADAENSGGIPQMRTVLRVMASAFPPGTGPEQGGIVTLEGERSQVSDILPDPAGWYDLVLVGAPEE